MRLSSSPAAVCLASLCLATTTTEAFFVPVASLTRTSLTQGRGAACARCASPVTAKMTTMKANGSNSRRPSPSKRANLRNAVDSLFSRRRGTKRGQGELEGSVALGDDVVRVGEGQQRRPREVVRKGFTALATAVIVRSTFKAQPASAITPMMRGPSARQQMIEKEHKEERRLEALEKMQQEQKEALESATSDLNGPIDAEAGGEAGEQGAAAGVGTVAGEGAGQAAVAEVEAPVKKARKPSRHERTLALRAKTSGKGFNPNTYPIKKVDAGTFGSVLMGGLAIYNIVSSFKGSTEVMGRQRRRVKVEGAKFDQQKEEFMDVEGEAEVDVDIMKELRDMKEKMAGPGDKYAKDTRAYNPDFAAEHPEEEYDAKLEEALRQRGRKGKTSNKGEKGIVFSSEDNPSAENDEDGEGEGGGGESAEAAMSQSDADANSAMQAKKDADVKRLQNLFNSSPSEDGDTPEDDLGDKRELLP